MTVVERLCLVQDAVDGLIAEAMRAAQQPGADMDRAVLERKRIEVMRLAVPEAAWLRPLR